MDFFVLLVSQKAAVRSFTFKNKAVKSIPGYSGRVTWNQSFCCPARLPFVGCLGWWSLLGVQPLTLVADSAPSTERGSEREWLRPSGPCPAKSTSCAPNACQASMSAATQNLALEGHREGEEAAKTPPQRHRLVAIRRSACFG